MFFYKKVLVLEIIVLMIVSFNWIKEEKQYNDFFESLPSTGIAKIISFKEEKEYRNQYIVEYHKYKFLLYTDKKSEFKYGDVVAFTGNFEKAKSSGNRKIFDYSRYLRQNKIYGILKVEKVRKLYTEKDIAYYIENFKRKLKGNLFLVFDSNEAGFLAGLLLGDKSEVLETTKEDFQNSSLSHILAISGMHVVYVTMGMKWILDLLTPRQRFKNGFMIFFLIFFAIFTGSSPSCLRACIMCSIVFFSKLVYRQPNFYMSLLVSLDVILIINCYYLESVGLWLSFLTTFGIVYFNPKNTVMVSIVCNAMIIPIVWNCYNKVSLVFCFSNLIASILIGPIMILGYIHLFLGSIISCFAFAEKALLTVLFQVAEFFSSFKISRILVPSIPVYFWVFYYILLIGFKYFYCHKDIFQKWKKSIIGIIILFFIIGIIILIPKENDLEIHFLNVGQGDCTLIITPKKKTILIDGGNNEGYDYGKNVIVTYLLKNGFCKVDYIMISHRRFRPYWWTILCFRKYGSRKCNYFLSKRRSRKY